MSKDIEMSVSEHLEELRQRILYSILFFVTATVLVFFNINFIVEILQRPALGVKFLQLAPGEYFFSTVKISFYCGLIIAFPFVLYQIVLFVLPGLTIKESRIFVPLLLISFILFITGLSFAYFILAPAALQFFITYGSNLVEPLWSFEQYFDFVLLLLISTGIAFQIPIIQIILGGLKIVSTSQMLSIWKYIILFSTIIGAILTPSTDPITQILMSSAVLVLYCLGLFILLFIEKLNI
uniref:Sec-independent translocase component C n=1 Tax=Pulvinaster venetus TaxID=427767 RepID=UPI001FCD6D51|nr:Sec-independent translocase component C [Pulvinaster venetus]UNJ16912.1 Sec-independent translocase component C [Pulvinaster venetus]